jgi:hypothetical protein
VVTLCGDSIFAKSGPSWRIDCLEYGLETVRGSDAVFWKDSLRATGRRFEQLKIPNEIHDRGYVPSVVQHNKYLASDRPDSNVIAIAISSGITDESSAGERIKYRLIMQSTGKKLEKCPSVREALMVFYDVLEGGSCSRCARPFIH